jgi:hypothetical protein
MSSFAHDGTKAVPALPLSGSLRFRQHCGTMLFYEHNPYAGGSKPRKEGAEDVSD